MNELLKKLKGVAGVLMILALVLVPVAVLAADMNVNWPAAPAPEQVTGWEIWVGTNGLNPAQYGPAIVINSDATNYTFVDINPGVYALAIRSVNLAGTSPYSDIANGPTAPSKPGTPVITIDP